MYMYHKKKTCCHLITTSATSDLWPSTPAIGRRFDKASRRRNNMKNLKQAKQM